MRTVEVQPIKPRHIRHFSRTYEFSLNLIHIRSIDRFWHLIVRSVWNG